VRNTLYILMFIPLCFILISCAGHEKRSKDAQAHYLLGVAHLREDKPTHALQEFLYAVEADPRDAEIHAALGHTYHLKKAYPDAEKHFLKALSHSEGNPLYQNNLAALYLDMERWDDAVRYFRLASSNILFPSSEIALTGLGYAYSRKGDYLQAVSALTTAIEQRSKYPPAHFYLGEVYLALGKTQMAIDEYKTAIASSPNYVLAHFQLGLLYMKEKLEAKAMESFREVVRLSPESDPGRDAAKYLTLLR